MTQHHAPEASIYGRFAASARRWPERPFLNVLPETAEAYGIEAGELTFGAALQEIDRLRTNDKTKTLLKHTNLFPGHLGPHPYSFVGLSTMSCY